MERLERLYKIDRSGLDERFYTESLLEAAQRVLLLDDVDLMRIQAESLALLAEKTAQYTGGESSSVRVEAAQSLMASNLYVIGTYLKSFPHPDDAVQALRETSVRELYAQGKKRVHTKVRVARQRYRTALSGLLPTENEIYRTTMVSGIRGFFKRYDPEFSAQELHITADYPLCCPVRHLTGIEFIQGYLDAIICENAFCNLFSAAAIEHLLLGYDKGYRHLIFNLFEQVLTAAVGCILAGEPIAGLSVPKGKAIALQAQLLHRSRQAVDVLTAEAFERLADELGLAHGTVRRYAARALPNLASSLFHAVEQLVLDRVLLEASGPGPVPPAVVSLGERMAREDYRTVLDEVAQCRFALDQIAMVRENIHSLADLETLLLDVTLKEEAVSALLGGLGDAELAVLIGRHPEHGAFDTADLSAAETDLRVQLSDCLRELPDERSAHVLAAAALIAEIIE